MNAVTSFLNVKRQHWDYIHDLIFLPVEELARVIGVKRVPGQGMGTSHRILADQYFQRVSQTF